MNYILRPYSLCQPANHNLKQLQTQIRFLGNSGNIWRVKTIELSFFKFDNRRHMTIIGFKQPFPHFLKCGQTNRK
jgi:hypothetical protein